MDPELRSYLRAFLVLSSALVVATMGLLVVTVDRLFLPIVIVGIVTTFVAGAVFEYAATVTDQDDVQGSDDPSPPPHS